MVDAKMNPIDVSNSEEDNGVEETRNIWTFGRMKLA
jgi:hypothetical protein